MQHETAQAAGWLIDGFQTMALLAIWGLAVVAYGFFWRSLSRPEPDAIRSPGPLGD